MKKYIIKIITLAIIIVFTLEGLSIVFLHSLRTDYQANNDAFYVMDNNTIDVLFVGSSHSYCGYTPKVLLDEYNISAYNLASPNQNATVDLLWAKEAKKYQDYKVLIVDAFGVYTISNDDNYLFSNIRSISSMWPSKTYYEYSKFVRKKAIPKVLFPIFILHDRWNELNKDAFVREITDETIDNRGFKGVDSNSVAGEENAIPTLDGISKEIANTDYSGLDMIREFCNDNGIKLIMVKSAQCKNNNNIWNDEMHNAIQQYCDNYGIEFYDFNTKELIEMVNIDLANDVSGDRCHNNIKGAQKQTRYIGMVLESILKSN